VLFAERALDAGDVEALLVAQVFDALEDA